jgi:hypothetical protein
VAHFSWVAEARTNGLILSVGAALAHFLAGAITGRRLLREVYAGTANRAGLLGAATSGLALGLFSIAFAAYIAGTEAGHESVLSHVMLTILIGVFSSLAVWWAFVVVSVCLAWGLFQASRDSDA